MQNTSIPSKRIRCIFTLIRIKWKQPLLGFVGECLSLRERDTVSSATTLCFFHNSKCTTDTENDVQRGATLGQQGGVRMNFAVQLDRTAVLKGPGQGSDRCITLN